MGEKPLHELIFNVGAVAPNAPTLTKTLNQAGHSFGQGQTTLLYSQGHRKQFQPMGSQHPFF